MPRYRTDIQQNTPEWYAARAGKWSASMAGVIMGDQKGDTLKAYIQDIAWERCFGPIEERSYRGGAMERGHEIEPQAREWAAFILDTTIEECGLVEHEELNVVWSPDGLHHKRQRAIEAKSPLHRAMMECIRKNAVPAQYVWQCKWGSWVGALDGMDFIAFHPKFGGIHIPVEVTASECDQMASRVYLLEKDVAKWVDLIQSRQMQ